MRGALDVHRDLLAKDVAHEVVRLPSRLVHADDLPGQMGLDRGCVSVRCYVVERVDGACFAAVLVPAGCVPSPVALLAALGARSVRPARPEQVNAATDYAAGLVCPVGLPSDVEVLADTALEASPTSYCAIGEGGVALGISTQDLLRVSAARRASLTGDTGDRVISLDTPQAVDAAAPGAAHEDRPGRRTRSSDVL